VYKRCRGYLLNRLEQLVPPRLVVLHGATGVGKTRILHRLPNHLDLEGLAQHRSSLFGAVNKTPRTQQQFEAHLLAALEALDRSRPVWIEGESRKVGKVLIPPGLDRAMRQATAVLLTASLKTRVARTVAEYTGVEPAAFPAEAIPDGTRPPSLSPDTLAQLERALTSLSHLFGKARVDQLILSLRRGDVNRVAETLLTEYYDPRYSHAMRHYQYTLELSAEDESQAAASLLAFGRTLPVSRA